MEKNIQPQFVVWPLIGGVFLLVFLIALVWWLIRIHKAGPKYEAELAQWRTEQDAWNEAARKDKKAFEAGQDKLPKSAFRDYWNAYEYERQNPQPERPRQDTTHWADTWQFILSMCLGLSLLIVLIPVNIGIFAPFNAKYYTYDHVQGTITQINGASQPDGKYVVTNWVFKLDGDKNLYTTDDERIQAYKIGDTVDLTCSAGWNPNGLDSHDCQIRSVQK